MIFVRRLGLLRMKIILSLSAVKEITLELPGFYCPKIADRHDRLPRASLQTDKTPRASVFAVFPKRTSPLFCLLPPFPSPSAIRHLLLPPSSLPSLPFAFLLLEEHRDSLRTSSTSSRFFLLHTFCFVPPHSSTRFLPRRVYSSSQLANSRHLTPQTFSSCLPTWTSPWMTWSATAARVVAVAATVALLPSPPSEA